MTRLFTAVAVCLTLLLLPAAGLSAQSPVGISGAVEWDRMEINAEIRLDLAAAGLRLPSGRLQGESILATEYLRLIRPEIMGMQVDSSSTVADLVLRGEWSLSALENLALLAHAVPPALSPGLDTMLGRYTLGISGIGGAFVRHRQPVDVPRTLTPVTAPAYTGILIVAVDRQRIHGRETAALVRPALFPKIWDERMSLVFERNMLDPAVDTMVRYFPMEAIFSGGPSGISPELASVVGERPLRIFASGVFGEVPTDPIISREDSLLIISTPENRALLRSGRVAFILDDSVLRSPFSGR